MLISYTDVVRDQIAPSKPDNVNVNIRMYVEQNPTSYMEPLFDSFFYDIIKELWMNKNQGIKEQCNIIILGVGGDGNMVSFSSIIQGDDNRTKFLKELYDTYISYLVLPLIHPQYINALQSINNIYLDTNINLTFFYIIEIITSFIHLHSYHIRYYITSYTLARRIVELINYNVPEITLSIIRFIKELIVGSEKLNIKQIVTHNLLQPLLIKFHENGNKYNLLNSSILDLLQDIINV